MSDLARATLFRKGPADAAALAEIHQRLAEELPRYEAALSGDFFSAELSLADFTVYPRVRFICRIDERQPGEDWGRHIPPRIADWMKRIEALPYYARTIPPHWKA
jgi:glutathione S-transferase